jgi:hypothetical protein
VIALRNWSVHYRPQSYSHDEPDLRAKIEDARSRIVENALMTGSNKPWFPDRALGAGCARSAVQTVRAFVDEFVAAMGCRADYRDFTPYGVQPERPRGELAGGSCSSDPSRSRTPASAEHVRPTGEGNGAIHTLTAQRCLRWAPPS